MSVCLLERGKAYPPGSFARSPWEIGRNFWDPSEGLQGLFNVWSFRGLGGIVASGLGGGSLVYSNVLIRKDESTFVQDELETWPVEYEDLEPHYARHEDMLAAAPYPFEPDRRSATRPRTVRPHLQDDALQRRRRAPRARVVPAEARGRVLGGAAGRQVSPSRSSASPRTSTGACGRRAACAASATSAATTARRTRSTSTTSPTRRFGTARRSSRGVR